MKNFILNIYKNKNKNNYPKKKNFYNWIYYFKKNNQIIINIQIVNKKTIKILNNKYKKINKITNVLTFDLNFEKNNNIIGNIIFCDSIIKEEANKFKKPLIEYWKHLTIHSILHLKGYTHEIIKKTLKMELIEEKIIFNKK